MDGLEYYRHRSLIEISEPGPARIRTGTILGCVLVGAVVGHACRQWPVGNRSCRSVLMMMLLTRMERCLNSGDLFVVSTGFIFDFANFLKLIPTKTGV